MRQIRYSRWTLLDWDEISLAELINLIAQPYAFDRFCCRAA